MRRESNNGKILPFWLPAGVIVACLAAVLFLLPSGRSLLENQIADGQFERALTTLRQITPSVKSSNPAYYDLTELQLLRKTMRQNNPKEASIRLAAACPVCIRHNYKPAFISEITQLLPPLRNTTVAWQTMTTLLTNAPPAARASLYQALTTQALSENTPVLAARIYDEYWKQSAQTELETEKLAQLWRQAGQPLKSLEALDFFIQHQDKSSPGTFTKLERTRIDILRETSQPERAFEAARKLLKQAPASDREPLFRLMAFTALESNRLQEIMPELLTRSKERLEDVETLEWIGLGALSAQNHELAQATFTKLAELRPASGLYCFRLGQIHEWRNQIPKAFDFHLKALSYGETNAIPRLLALVRGLYREGELAEVLADKLNAVKKMGLEFEFARLQGRVGNFDQAVKGYEEQLRQHPPTMPLLKEYGQFLSDLYEYEKAMSIYEKAVTLDPRDLSVKRAIAELKFRLGNYQGAFQDYESLLTADSNTETLENYLVLAESLGKTDKIVSGLRQKLVRSTNTTAQVFQQLAYYQNALGKPREAEISFTEGLARYPQDRMLRLQAAHFYADSGNYAKASEVIRQHPALKTDIQVAQFYVNLLLLSQNYKAAEAFIKNGVSAELANSPAMLEPQALICEAGNRMDEAAAIYARLMELDPGNARYLANCARLLSALGQSKKALAMIRPYLKNPPPDICHLLAQVFASAGDYKNAEIYERRHIESHPAKVAEAWGFLGDILLARGQKSRARSAYSNGFNAMTRSMENP